jgi:predicted GNAT family acetyltransferase
MADTVVHDESGSRFVLMRGDEELGEAAYITREDGGIVFTHTEIRPEIQERGLGSVLVKGALEQLRTSTDVRIGATCPFVRKYLSDHPEFEDLTSRGRG